MTKLELLKFLTEAGMTPGKASQVSIRKNLGDIFHKATGGLLKGKQVPGRRGVKSRRQEDKDLKRELDLYRQKQEGKAKISQDIKSKYAPAPKEKKIKDDNTPQPGLGEHEAHKFINNYLLRNKLRSIKVKGLPTVEPSKSSGRFATVDQSGRPQFHYYPYANANDAIEKGYIQYDVNTKRFRDVPQPLSYAFNILNDPGFISLENSISNVPHYTK